MLFGSAVTYAEENSDATSDSSSSVAAKPPRNVQKLSIDSAQTLEGIYYGYLSFIHPEGLSIVVIPQRSGLPRRTFMLDAKTSFWRDKKRIPRSEVTQGDKVAIRYVGEPPLYLADVVYLVKGAFELKDYEKKKKSKKSRGPGAAKKSGGGH